MTDAKVQVGAAAVGATSTGALAELLTLWPRLTDEARQSLLRIARAKAGARGVAVGVATCP